MFGDHVPEPNVGRSRRCWQAGGEGTLFFEIERAVDDHVFLAAYHAAATERQQDRPYVDDVVLFADEAANRRATFIGVMSVKGQVGGILQIGALHGVFPELKGLNQ